MTVGTEQGPSRRNYLVLATSNIYKQTGKRAVLWGWEQVWIPEKIMGGHYWQIEDQDLHRKEDSVSHWMSSQGVPKFLLKPTFATRCSLSTVTVTHAYRAHIKEKLCRCNKNRVQLLSLIHAPARTPPRSSSSCQVTFLQPGSLRFLLPKAMLRPDMNFSWVQSLEFQDFWCLFA